jgi:glycosyltransferase involved in cell wall biosynthesis
MRAPIPAQPTLPPGISVVVPVYNSAPSLLLLVDRLKPVLTANGQPHELILVNDGSRDNSWEVIDRLTRQQSWVRGISLMRNYGQHNALLCGIRHARYDLLLTLDDDLQHPPEEAPRLLAKFREGFDVVYGPPLDQRHGLVRNLASRITKAGLQTTVGAETAQMVCAFRIFRTQLRDAFADYNSPYVNIDVLLTWGTTRFGSVAVKHETRSEGCSNYNYPQLLRHALNMMTGFSVVPLQLASVLGLACTLFGLGVLVFVVGRYFIAGSSVSGFPFLASIIAIFSGAQLLTLGIMGEYLARMHFRLMEKPAYTVNPQPAAPANPTFKDES